MPKRNKAEKRLPCSRSARAYRLSSSDLLIALIDEAEKLWPHNASVTTLTLRAETPSTYISARVPASAFSKRCWRSNVLKNDFFSVDLDEI